MTTYIHLTRPPLREAAIHIQLAEELPATFVNRMKDILLAGFEKNLPIKKGRFSFQLNADSPAQASVTSDEADGYRYQSGDGARVVQLRRSAMTFSVLQGYTDWDDIRYSASAVWNQYLSMAGPVVVDRVAVRYINVIGVPLGADFDDYLAAGPRIPSKLPQSLLNFFHRVVVPFSDAEATAIVTQASEPPTQANAPVLLDLEINAQCKAQGSSTEIWSRLEQLREIKNLVFFSSLTEKALGLYR